MNTHEFHDMPSRLQLFSEETTTQYLNLEHDEFSQTKIGVEKGKDDYYFQGKLVWSETKQIEVRRVIGVMDFLGKAGGLHSSIFIIGGVINFAFSGANPAMQLLLSHYYVNDNPEFERGGSYLRGYARGGLSNNSCFSRILHWLPSYMITCCKCNLKQSRFKRLIQQTDAHLERSLDIRTILRLQSTMLAIVRTVFDCDDEEKSTHLSLLALQRNGNLMDIDDRMDPVDCLLYGLDDEKI